MQRSFRTLAPILLALALFLVNSLTPMRDAMAVLYTLVVMLVADAGGRRLIAATGIGCCLLAVLSFLIKHSGEAPDGAYVRLAVSLTAIAVATVLAVRARQARTRLAEQIGLLAATHDTVIVRDPGDIILEWNEGATRLYGWSREEAIGRSAAQLLQTRYREGAPPRLSPGGRWSGEIARQRRDGTPVPLSSRWIGRLDENGRAAGIIELSADLTEQRVAEQASARSQRRYAAIFHGAGMPILEACLSPPAEGRTRRLTVRDGNQAAARLLAVEPAALPGLELLERLPSAGAETLDAALARLSRGEATIELSCTLVDSHGRMRDVVLTISRTDGEDASDVVLLTALDVTEREAALHRIERLRVDLWHAARLSTLGQMTASIAHEVNQPVQATMNFARSAQLWLQRTPPELDEAAALPAAHRRHQRTRRSRGGPGPRDEPSRAAAAGPARPGGTGDRGAGDPGERAAQPRGRGRGRRSRTAEPGARRPHPAAASHGQRAAQRDPGDGHAAAGAPPAPADDRR